MDVLPFLNQFIESFESLDLPEMMRFFSDDATMFFPVRHCASKVTGKTHIASRFEDVIMKMKDSGLTMISLPVQDLDIDIQGETAVTSFHILDNELSRRTIVLRKTGDSWLITHFHASNAPLEGKP